MKYVNYWRIKNLSNGEVAICEASHVLSLLIDFTRPYEAFDPYVNNEIFDICESIHLQCLSGCKGPDFEADCSFLNVRLDRMPEYMTEEDLCEFLYE